MTARPDLLPPADTLIADLRRSAEDLIEEE